MSGVRPVCKRVNYQLWIRVFEERGGTGRSGVGWAVLGVGWAVFGRVGWAVLGVGWAVLGGAGRKLPAVNIFKTKISNSKLVSLYRDAFI